MVDPKVWGSDAWYFMHSLIQHFRPGQISRYRQLFRSIRFILPCTKCRKNYSNDLGRNRLNKIVNLQSLKRWIRRMHNLTNKTVGIPPIKNYNLPPNLNHKRIIRFLRFALQDSKKSQKQIVEMNRIRRLLVILLPCP
ncbi:unnamed protein product, partial [marine sediment metagenome]